MNPKFLDLAEVLEIHRSRIELYGGKEGLRDINLLQSALAQPSAGYRDSYLHPDLYAMAAAYLFHIARNHAFLAPLKNLHLYTRDKASDHVFMLSPIFSLLRKKNKKPVKHNCYYWALEVLQKKCGRPEICPGGNPTDPSHPHLSFLPVKT